MVLLASIYPVVTEPISFDDMMDAFAAARKYDMATVSQRLVEKFADSEVVQDSPVKAFCVAYSRGLGEPARIAAKASLKYRMSLNSIKDQLRYTNGPALYQLYKFHRACSATAAETVSESNRKLPWITQSDSTWWHFASKNRFRGDCQCSTPIQLYTLGSGPPYTEWIATSPWQNYIKRAHNVLLKHPCSEAVACHSITKPSYDEIMCVVCQKTIHGLQEFARLLGEEVERRVSKVSIFLYIYLTYLAQCSYRSST